MLTVTQLNTNNTPITTLIPQLIPNFVLINPDQPMSDPPITLVLVPLILVLILLIPLPDLWYTQTAVAIVMADQVQVQEWAFIGVKTVISE